jgi:NADH-quinone oxidoreductase subunit L
VGIVKQGWLESLVVQPELSDFGTGGHEAAHGHASSAHHDLHEKAHHTVSMLSLLAAGFGILLAFLTYIKGMISAAQIRQRFRGPAVFLENLWYFDKVYEAVLVRGLHKWNAAVLWFDQKIVDGLVNGSAFSSDWFSRLIGRFDNVVIDGVVNFMATISFALGREFSRLQSGRIQGYIFIGLLALCLYVLIDVM